jgi:hypothetical protein
VAIFSTYFAYKFVSQITSRWEDTDAFKDGKIDNSGNVLPGKSLNLFDRLVVNLKKVLGSSALGRSLIGRYAAAAYLLKEAFPENYSNNLSLIVTIFEQVMANDKTSSDNKYNSIVEDTERASIVEMIREDMTTTASFDGGSFAGSKVYPCDQDRFHKCRLGKKSRYHRWSSYIGDDELGQEIKAFAQANPKSPIILQNTKDKAMLYLRK